MGLYSISPMSKREYIKWSKGESQNIVQQQFNPMQPNEIWASDITQFMLHQQTYYICVILDLFSRKVVAYRVSESQSTQLVTLTFKQAYMQRLPPVGLIFHSDRGSQYLSKAFRNLLADNNVIQSLSRPGKPHDKAVMGSFFAILKKEELYRYNYKSQAVFLQSVNHYMEFYNSQRPHSTLQYKTPDTMEDSFLKQAKTEQ